MSLFNLDDADTATILAALRFYQDKGQGNPDNRSDAIHDIATAGGEQVSMDDEGIDELCERLNGPSTFPSVRTYYVKPTKFVPGESGSNPRGKWVACAAGEAEAYGVYWAIDSAETFHGCFGPCVPSRQMSALRVAKKLAKKEGGVFSEVPPAAFA